MFNPALKSGLASFHCLHLGMGGLLFCFVCKSSWEAIGSAHSGFNSGGAQTVVPEIEMGWPRTRPVPCPHTAPLAQPAAL